MKKKQIVKPKKINLLLRLIDARYITLTGKYEPLVNRKIQQIIYRCS